MTKGIDELVDLLPKEMLGQEQEEGQGLGLEMMTELEIEQGIQEGLGRKAKANRKLRGRRLDQEWRVLKQFLAEGHKAAKIRVRNWAEGKSLQHRLYFSRAQARLRVGDLKDMGLDMGHEGQWVEDAEQLWFTVGEDERGAFVAVALRARLKLEVE